MKRILTAIAFVLSIFITNTVNAHNQELTQIGDWVVYPGPVFDESLNIPVRSCFMGYRSSDDFELVVEFNPYLDTYMVAFGFPGLAATVEVTQIRFISFIFQEESGSFFPHYIGDDTFAVIVRKDIPLMEYLYNENPFKIQVGSVIIMLDLANTATAIDAVINCFNEVNSEIIAEMVPPSPENLGEYVFDTNLDEFLDFGFLTSKFTMGRDEAFINYLITNVTENFSLVPYKYGVKTTNADGTIFGEFMTYSTSIPFEPEPYVAAMGFASKHSSCEVRTVTAINVSATNAILRNIQSCFDDEQRPFSVATYMVYTDHNKTWIEISFASYIDDPLVSSRFVTLLSELSLLMR
jgi:hypothetical protein